MSDLPPKIAAAVASLVLDALTIEVMNTFKTRGIQAILLKGPSIRHWLYTSAAERRYIDTDVLVTPSQAERALSLLIEMGFAPPPEQLPGNRPWVSVDLQRADGAVVDLHRSIAGIGVDPQQAWIPLSKATELLDLRGTAVTILNEPGRSMHVALHAAQHGPRARTPLRDLRRAIDVVDYSTWVHAAELAATLDATAAFASGLRLVPEGERLAGRLGVADRTSVEVNLTSGSLEETALSFGLGFEWLSTRPGLAAKVRYVATKLFPPRRWIRGWTPIARRGPLGLAIAYIRRWAWLGLHAYPGYRAWRRAKKQLGDPRVKKTD